VPSRASDLGWRARNRCAPSAGIIQHGLCCPSRRRWRTRSRGREWVRELERPVIFAANTRATPTRRSSSRAFRPRRGQDRRRRGSRLLVQAASARQHRQPLLNTFPSLGRRAQASCTARASCSSRAGTSSCFPRQPLAGRPHPGVQARRRTPRERDRDAGGADAHPRGVPDHAARAIPAAARAGPGANRQADGPSKARARASSQAASSRPCARWPGNPSTGDPGRLDREVEGAQAPRARVRVVTYSIVARDAATGELGVAVQSHYFQVGPVVPWALAGVGAIATHRGSTSPTAHRGSSC